MLKLNLLPPKQKEIFEWEKNRRLVIFSAGVLFLFFLFFAGLLFSSVLYVRIQLEPLEEAIEREKVREETLRAENLETNTREFVQKLRNIRDIQKESSAYTFFLRELVTLPPSGVVLALLSITETSSDGVTVKTVRMNGHADTRSQVIAMETAIKEGQYFSDLNSPFSNKNKETDINFTFTFTVTE